MTHRTFAREIVWSPEDCDFAMYLDGNLVGFARSYQEAEAALDALVYDILRQVTVDLADEQADKDAAAEARAA